MNEQQSMDLSPARQRLEVELAGLGMAKDGPSGGRPRVAMILGSGLAGLADEIQDGASTFLRSVTVSEAMTAEPVTVQPETTLRAAAELMLERKIGCVPVVKPDGALVGLVTETDMLTAAFLVDDE